MSFRRAVVLLSVLIIDVPWIAGQPDHHELSPKETEVPQNDFHHEREKRGDLIGALIQQNSTVFGNGQGENAYRAVIRQNSNVFSGSVDEGEIRQSAVSQNTYGYGGNQAGSNINQVPVPSQNSIAYYAAYSTNKPLVQLNSQYEARNQPNLQYRTYLAPPQPLKTQTFFAQQPSQYQQVNIQRNVQAPGFPQPNFSTASSYSIPLVLQRRVAGTGNDYEEMKGDIQHLINEVNSLKEALARIEKSLGSRSN